MQIQLKLPKVTVIGFMKKQQNAIYEKLKGRANFNFVDKNRKVKVVSSNQDIVCLAVSFLSHAVYFSVKRQIEGTGAMLVTHHGGVDILIQKLNNLLPS